MITGSTPEADNFKEYQGAKGFKPEYELSTDLKDLISKLLIALPEYYPLGYFKDDIIDLTKACTN